MKKNNLLTKDEIKKIGTEHNRLLINIINLSLKDNASTIAVKSSSQDIKMKNSEYLSSDLFRDVNIVLTQNNYPSVERPEFDYMLANYNTNVIDVTAANEIASLPSYEGQLIMNDLVGLINSSTEYNTFMNGIPSLVQRAESSLTDINQTAVLIAIEVAINSAYMWFPVEGGGQGYFDLIQPNIYSFSPSSISLSDGLEVKSTSQAQDLLRKKVDVTPRGKLIGKVVTGDVIGAFAGFMRAALPYFVSGGPFNPISNGILFGSSLIGGIQGSATAGFAASYR